VPELLELAHFVKQHGMPQVQIRRRRIEARLDAQRLPLFQLAQELGLDEDIARPALDLGEL
jgi:predicted TIM-barrel fold metal-dependent hydrolase